MAFLGLMIIILAALMGMIYFSPYSKGNHYAHKALENSIAINAPVSHVYQVLGNSENARKWSVFVHHITALNPDEVKDGEVGSMRRCFGNEEETGLMWDEEVIVNQKNVQRRLSIFNLVGFDLTADHLLTDQLYEETAEGTTKLTFTLFYDPKETVSAIDELKLYFAAYTAGDIFERNLENIKYLAEENEGYERRHPFLKIK